MNNEIMNGLVRIVDGRIVTSSLTVASKFGKNHPHILRDIRKLLKEDVSNFGHMFLEGIYTDDYDREQIKYLITRDGFTFLVMGFTGEKARQFKLDYISQFNRMEEYIRNQPKIQMIQDSYMIEDPIKRAERWIEEKKEKEQLRIELKVVQPKIEYHDKILNSISKVTTTTIAKQLGMSATKLNKILKDEGIQYKSGKQWVIKAKYEAKGLHAIGTHPYTSKDGLTQKSVSHLYWSEVGRKFIIDLVSSL